MQARVVVDHVDDLHDLARGQLPRGDVCLPALVWELCFEADQRALGALLALRDDQALTSEDPPDRREGGNVSDVLTQRQVVGDRLRAGVMALALELSAQLNDRLHEPGRGFVLARARAPGTR